MTTSMNRRTFVKGSLAASAMAALAACGKKGSTGAATSGKATGGTLNYYILQAGLGAHR